MDNADILANALSNQWNITTAHRTPRFIKLKTSSDDEIIVNTSAITFIDINSNSIVVQNTDVYGNGKLCLTKDSMQKLISTLDCK
nr:MAG TPA: hypothetical protein [Caudoviricetes sp.]